MTEPFDPTAQPPLPPEAPETPETPDEPDTNPPASDDDLAF